MFNIYFTNWNLSIQDGCWGSGLLLQNYSRYIIDCFETASIEMNMF